MTTATIVNGVEFPISWIFKVDSTTPKNLTGFTVLVQIRPTKNSSTILASYTQASSQITFSPTIGRVDLLLPPSITSGFTFHKAVIDCWVKDAINVDGDRSGIVELIYDTGVSRI